MISTVYPTASHQIKSSQARQALMVGGVELSVNNVSKKEEVLMWSDKIHELHTDKAFANAGFDHLGLCMFTGCSVERFSTVIECACFKRRLSLPISKAEDRIS